MAFRRLWLIVAALVFWAPVCATAQSNLVEEPLRIPMAAAGPLGLEALLVKPAGPGRHPLMLVNHGTPRETEDRSQLTPQQWLPQLEAFARRGWTAVAVMRRGYGNSPGDFAESFGLCRAPDYVSAARAGAEDLRAAIAALAQRPDVDASRIVSIGASAGGYATIALTDDPPPGLVAAISFAGARGSLVSDHVCDPDALVAAFSALGKRSRLPMLWVYAQNDHYYPVPLAQQLRQAFVASGGNVDFVVTPPFGKDGHDLFLQPGMSIWLPIVDQFLDSHGLKLVTEPMPEAPQPRLDPPPQLDPKGRDAFERYLAAPPHKAFAVAPDGAYGWRSGRRSEDEARLGAMENCGDRDTVDCRVVSVDGAWAPGGDQQ
jgi:dienelactone hydrolase